MQVECRRHKTCPYYTEPATGAPVGKDGWIQETIRLRYAAKSAGVDCAPVIDLTVPDSTTKAKVPTVIHPIITTKADAGQGEFDAWGNPATGEESASGGLRRELKVFALEDILDTTRYAARQARAALPRIAPEVPRT